MSKLTLGAFTARSVSNSGTAAVEAAKRLQVMGPSSRVVRA